MRIIDVPHDGSLDWGAGIRPVREAARALLAAFDGQVEESLRASGGWALLEGARALRRSFDQRVGPEIDAIAGALRVPAESVLLGNLAYDLTNAAACSTMVTDGGGTPTLARNLDWAFPGTLLRDHTVVLRDSEERLAVLERRSRASPPWDAATAFDVLSRPLFLRNETQHQVAMDAAAGILVVRVPGGGEWTVAA